MGLEKHGQSLGGKNIKMLRSVTDKVIDWDSPSLHWFPGAIKLVPTSVSKSALIWMINSHSSYWKFPGAADVFERGAAGSNQLEVSYGGSRGAAAGPGGSD